MTEPLQIPQPQASSPPVKEKKGRVRSIGWLWFLVILVLVAAGLCGAAVFFLHQEFVRAYGALDRKVTEVSGHLTGIEQDVKASQKERGSLLTDIKELNVKQRALQKEGQDLVRGWQEIREATLDYQGSLQTIVDELRRQQEIKKAMENPPAPAGKKGNVIEAEKK